MNHIICFILFVEHIVCVDKGIEPVVCKQNRPIDRDVIALLAFGDQLTAEARTTAVASIILLPIFTFFRLSTAVLRALGRATIGQAAEVNVRHILVIATIGLGVVIGYDQWTAGAALSANAFATMLEGTCSIVVL